MKTLSRQRQGGRFGMFSWERFGGTERGLREQQLVLEANIGADSVASEELLIANGEVTGGNDS